MKKENGPKSSSAALRKLQCEICYSVVAVVDQLQEQLDEITEVEQDERVSRHDIVKELNIDHQIAKRRMITRSSFPAKLELKHDEIAPFF